MAKVNPFIAPIPQKILDDTELRGYFEYLTQFLHDLWTRTGAGTDTIQNSVTNISVLDSDLTAVEAEIDVIQEQLLLDERVTAVDVTSSGSETIICTAPLTVTLQSGLTEVTDVIVNCLSYPVVVDGNGVNIIDSPTYTMLVNGESKTFRYSPARTQWYII